MNKIEHIKQGQTVYISYRGEIEKCIMRSYTKLHSMYVVYLYIPSKNTNICCIRGNGLHDLFLNKEEVFNYLIKYKSKDPRWACWE